MSHQSREAELLFVVFITHAFLLLTYGGTVDDLKEITFALFKVIEANGWQTCAVTVAGICASVIKGKK